MVRVSRGWTVLAGLAATAVLAGPAVGVPSATGAPLDGAERAAWARAAADGMRGDGGDDVARRRQTAETTSYADPTGDVVRLGTTPEQNAPADEPRADLVRGGATYDATGIDLSAELATFTDPATDSGWQEGRTSLLWVIDIEGDADADYEVVYFADETRIAAQVFRPGDRATPICDASGLVQGTTYLVDALPARCFGTPNSFVSYVSMNYDANPATPGTDVFGDVAPDNVYSSPVGPAGGPQPGQGRPTGRLSGANRFETSVQISRFTFPDGSVDVYLARADEPADAVSGGSLRDGPVLLVPACGTVPAVVINEIARLDPQRVVALGGPDAVCDAVLAQAAAA